MLHSRKYFPFLLSGLTRLVRPRLTARRSSQAPPGRAEAARQNHSDASSAVFLWSVASQANQAEVSKVCSEKIYTRCASLPTYLPHAPPTPRKDCDGPPARLCGRQCIVGAIRATCRCLYVWRSGAVACWLCRQTCCKWGCTHATKDMVAAAGFDIGLPELMASALRSTGAKVWNAIRIVGDISPAV